MTGERPPEPVRPPVLTRWQRVRRWLNYWARGPLHALKITQREVRYHLRGWLTRDVFLVKCDRCGTVRGHHERKLPDSGQLVCPTCQNEFEIAEIRAFLALPARARTTRTFHKGLYYDPDVERHRELGL